MAERLFHDLVKLTAVSGSVDAGTIGHIVVDRHRKWVRFLENHTDSAAQCSDISAVSIDILSVKCEGTGDTGSFNQIIHSIDGAQKGGFSAS